MEEIRPPQYALKPKIFLQFRNVPFSTTVYKKSMSELDVHNLGRLVIISGTVIRVSAAKTLERTKRFRCGTCNIEITLFAEHENYCVFQLPNKCRNTTQKPKKTNPFFAQQFWAQKKKENGQPPAQFAPKQPKLVEAVCGGQIWETVPNSGQFVDYQEIKIQEPFKTIKPGNIPKSSEARSN